MPMKPATVYARALAARLKVPPTSSQTAYYEAIAQMFMDIVADADVQGAPVGDLAHTLMAPSGGGPVTGTAKIT